LKDTVFGASELRGFNLFNLDVRALDFTGDLDVYLLNNTGNVSVFGTNGTLNPTTYAF